MRIDLFLQKVQFRYLPLQFFLIGFLDEMIDLLSHVVDRLGDLIQFIPAFLALPDRNPVIQPSFTNGFCSLTNLIHFFPERPAVEIDSAQCQHRTHKKYKENPGCCHAGFFIITSAVCEHLKFSTVSGFVFHQKLLLQIQRIHFFSHQIRLVGGLDLSVSV